MLRSVLVMMAIVALVSADVFLHNPRGSNNKVDDNNNNAPQNRLFNSQNSAEGGYNSGMESHGMLMKYYEGSMLMMEWTAQHACGTNTKNSCNIVLQYRCDDLMRDGIDRDTAPVTRGNNVEPQPISYEPEEDYGRHEPYANWYECNLRERNRGLFTATENLGSRATSTRQRPNGNRYGYECNEERDYYPYWLPTLWKDIAVLTSNISRCEYYQQESQNVAVKGYCSDNPAYGMYESCTAAGHNWVEAQAWQDQQNSGVDGPPECKQVSWSRANVHTTVSPTPGASAEEQDGTPNMAATYNWTIPSGIYGRCLVRLRYNITAGDANWDLDYTSNGAANSPITEDPVVDVGGSTGSLNLQMDIDPSQFARTFQDRSNIFEIREKPDNLVTTNQIINVNVRGKRGNIVQTFPAMEYDFIPNHIHVEHGQFVHWQWTGSNFNQQGTDRHNFMQMNNLGDNYPAMGNEIDFFGDYDDEEERIYNAATSGGSSDPNLQDVPAYYDMGPIRMNDQGTRMFFNSKNNAFSNRGQKGVVVTDPNYLGYGLGIAGGVVAVGLIVGVAIYLGVGSAIAGACGIGSSSTGNKSSRF